MAGTYPETYYRFFALFNAGQYWHAHEALEEQWLAEGRNPFLQGLILLAAGFVHVQKDNPPGCRKVLEKAAHRLAPYAPRHRGLDVAAILAFIQGALDRLTDRPDGQPLPGYIPYIRLQPEEPL